MSGIEGLAVAGVQETLRFRMQNWRVPEGAFKSFAAILMLVFLAGCTRPPELIGVDNPAVPARSVEDASKRKVYIVTTRQATEVVGAFFSGKRAPELGFASVVVSIPPNHVAGKIERPENLPPDPRTEFAIVEPTVYETDGSFVASLNRSLAALPESDQEILLFVHGYNNTISDSILRMAQFVEDTEFSGIPVLFAWASAAKTSQYVYDLNSALTARPLLLETADILARTRARGFDILAHSMGTFLMVETIVQANLAGNYNKRGRLRNVILAAPDIDLDLFRSQMLQLPEDDRNFFILVSADDKALGFSAFISGGIQRVGSANADELAGLGVTVLDLGQINNSASGTHSKFAGSPEIVQLIGNSLKAGNLDQSPRSGLVEMLAGIPTVVVGGN